MALCMHDNIGCRAACMNMHPTPDMHEARVMNWVHSIKGMRLETAEPIE